MEDYRTIKVEKSWGEGYKDITKEDYINAFIWHIDAISNSLEHSQKDLYDKLRDLRKDLWNSSAERFEQLYAEQQIES